MSYVTRSHWCGLVLQSDKKAGIHLKLVMVCCVTFRFKSHPNFGENYTWLYEKEG